MIPFAGALVGKTILGKVIGEKASKAIVIVAGVVLLIGALFALRACDKRNIIEEHTAGQEAATAKADRKADAKSAEERRADDARAATESQEIKEAIREAGPNPADRRAAYYECVRKQQAARREGKSPADC